MTVVATVLALASVFDEAAVLLASVDNETPLAVLEKRARMPWPLLTLEAEREIAKRAEELPESTLRAWANDRALPAVTGALGFDDEALATIAGALEPRARDGSQTLAILADARRRYASKAFDGAVDLYGQVERQSALWPSALRERGWSFYQLDRPADALGVSVSLAAPWFPRLEHAEARLLEATVLLDKCRWAEARERVEPFTTIADLPAPADARQAFVATEVDSRWARSLDSPLVSRVRALVLDAAPQTEAGRALLAEVVHRGERLLIDELARERNEQRGVARRAWAIIYESLRGERHALEHGLGSPTRRSPELPPLGDDDVAWEFQTTWWRDELGAYRYIAADACPHEEGR